MDVPRGQEGPNVYTAWKSQCYWCFSGQRIVVWVVVTGFHLALLMLLRREPSASTRVPLNAANATAQVIRIRFLPRELSASLPPAPKAPVLPRPLRRRASKASSLRSLPAPATLHRAERFETDIVTIDTSRTYIAGGGFLDRASKNAPSDNVRLPGSSEPIVKGLHMVDPRSRGIGGAVRTLQTMFGVPDPHCVNVEGWRGLSVRELLDRHMSPDQVEKTAQEYHCGPGR